MQSMLSCLGAVHLMEKREKTLEEEWAEEDPDCPFPYEIFYMLAIFIRDIRRPEKRPMLEGILCGLLVSTLVILLDINFDIIALHR